MRWMIRSLTVCGLLLTALSLPPAVAADTAVCTAGWVVTLTHGLTMAAGSDSFTTEGSPAYLDCTGSIAGQEITGPADYVEGGTVEGSCSAGHGKGSFRASIPTTGGVRVVEGAFEVTWAGPQGYFQGPQFSGRFEFYPVEGDCTNVPARKARVLTQGVLVADLANMG